MIKILKGEDVVEAYRNPSKHTKSSMTGNKFSDFIGFYADNPEKVGLVAAYDKKKNEMKARALLWNCDGGVKVLDGMYGNKSGIIELIEWCYKNNILFARYLSTNQSLNLGVTMNIKRNVFPYIDTFTFGILDREKRTVVLYPYRHKDADLIFCSHEGYVYALDYDEEE